MVLLSLSLLLLSKFENPASVALARSRCDGQELWSKDDVLWGRMRAGPSEYPRLQIDGQQHLLFLLLAVCSR